MEMLDKFFGQLGLRSTLVVLIALAALPLITIIIAMNLHWEATFSVNARTEIMQFETGQLNVPNWFVRFARIRIDGNDIEPFAGQIEIGRNTRVRLVRLQFGELRLSLEHSGEGYAATLYDDAENRIGVARKQLQAIIALPAEAAITLPIAGRAIIGDTIFSQSVETSPVLLAGHVQVFGLYAIGRNRFAAQQAELAAGDRLEIEYSKTSSGGHGMLRIEPAQAGLRVVFHADGPAARIIRFGTAGYELSPSMWARVSADPLYQSLLAIYAVLLPALGLGFASLFNQWRLRQMARRNYRSEDTADQTTERKTGKQAARQRHSAPESLQSNSDNEPERPPDADSEDDNA